MKTLCLSSLVLLSGLGLASSAWPQDSESQRAKDILKERSDFAVEITNIWNRIFATLPQNEAAIQKKIVIHILADNDIQECYAAIDRQTGEAVINISQSFLRSLYMFVMASDIAGRRRDMNIANRYINYVLKGFEENQRREKAGQPQRKIEAPQVWLRLPKDEEVAVIKDTDNMWAGNVAFILSHEVAHHILRHTADQKEEPREIILQREEAADAWAIRHLLSISEPPLAGSLSLAYFGALFEDLGDKAEHPAGSCRARAQYVATLENVQLFAPRLGERGVDVDQWKTRITAILNGMDNSEGGCIAKAASNSSVSDPGSATDEKTNRLISMLGIFVRGEDQASLCRTKGRLMDHDSTDNIYATRYSVDGWNSYISVDRSDGECFLAVSRHFEKGADAREVYQKLVAFVSRAVSDCQSSDSKLFDEKIRCRSVGVSVGYRESSRPYVSVTVDGR